MSEGDGIKGALTRAVAKEPAIDKPEQLDLIDPSAPAPQMPALRGRGRPTGALNKRTVETIRWLEARHGSVIGEIAKEAFASIKWLMDELGFATKPEAAEYRAKRRSELLPYLYAKMGTLSADNGGAAGGQLRPLFVLPPGTGAVIEGQLSPPFPDDDDEDAAE